ncbi:MAG: creatininase family protein [Burkholderiales bacterium]|nr:MAG: creatininase family protein [Burkholderiales bacterium]
MKLTSYWWAELTTRQFAQIASQGADDVVAVLPVAAIEQHGPHLPTSVDTALVNGVIAATLPHLGKTRALFLPTQQVGKSNEHQRFPGTLTLKAETLIALWTEIGESVHRAGIKKLVLLNSHGGQISVMDIVARDLRVRLDMLVFSTNWFTLPLGDEINALFTPEEHRFGIHGGDMETSMMLALAPHTVDMKQARDFKSSSQARSERYPILGNSVSAKMGWQIQDYNAFGACGNAAIATAEKGHAVINASAKKLAQLLQEISSLRMNTLVAKPTIPE